MQFSYADWLAFDQRLEAALAAKKVMRIPPKKVVMLGGEEWYQDCETGHIFIYVRPDSPILPVWKEYDEDASRPS